MSTDPGAVATQAAIDRLEYLDECLGIECEGGEAIWPEDLQAPYCGCNVCQVRETLAAAWPIIEKYVRDQRRLELVKPSLS